MTDLAILGLGAVTVPVYPTLTADQCRAVIENSQSAVVVVSTPAQLEKVRGACAAASARPRVHGRALARAACGDHALATLLERGERLRAAEPGAYRAMPPRPGPRISPPSSTPRDHREPKGAMLTTATSRPTWRPPFRCCATIHRPLPLGAAALAHLRADGRLLRHPGLRRIAYAQSLDTFASDIVAVRPPSWPPSPAVREVPRPGHGSGAGAAAGGARAVLVGPRARTRAGARPLCVAFGRRVTELQVRIADRLVLGKIRERLGGGCASASPAALRWPPRWRSSSTQSAFRSSRATADRDLPVICLNPLGRERLGTVGPPIPASRSGSVTRARFSPAASRHARLLPQRCRDHEAIRAGWFHTGDIGHLDSDGYLVITDRLKDLLVLAAGKKWPRNRSRGSSSAANG